MREIIYISISTPITFANNTIRVPRADNAYPNSLNPYLIA
jgi:hypothetical protein